MGHEIAGTMSRETDGYSFANLRAHLEDLVDPGHKYRETLAAIDGMVTTAERRFGTSDFITIDNSIPGVDIRDINLRDYAAFDPKTIVNKNGAVDLQRIYRVMQTAHRDEAMTRDGHIVFKAQDRGKRKGNENIVGADLVKVTIRLQNGEDITVPFVTRRGFVKGAAVAGVLLTACGVAINRALETPSPAPLPPITPTPTPRPSPYPTPSPSPSPPTTAILRNPNTLSPPEGLTVASVRQIITAFQNADRLTVGASPADIPVTGTGNETLRAQKIGPDTFLMGSAPRDEEYKTFVVAATETTFTGAVADVNLPFDGILKRPDGRTTGVDVTGMTTIVNIRPPNPENPDVYPFQDYFKAHGLLKEGEAIQFAGGNAGAELEGHAFVFAVISAGKINRWVVASPWLTPKDVIAEWVPEGQEISVTFYKRNGDQKGEPIAKESLAKLAVSINSDDEVTVSRDGEYKVDGRRLTDIWRENGVNAEVIKIYEEKGLFSPHMTADAWASKSGQVDSAQMKQYTGLRRSENHYIDLGFGTMNLAVQTDGILSQAQADLSKVADHNTARATVGVKLEADNEANNALKAQLMRVRANLLTTNPEEVDFRNFVVIVEAGLATLAYYRKKDQLIRYRVEKDGRITPEKEEPLKPPPPEIRVTPDKKLVNERGEVLKGSVITQFLYEYKDKSTRLRQANNALDSIKATGVNSVNFVLNTAFFEDPQYLSELSTVLKRARNLGVSTILSIHSDGSEMKSGATISTPKQLITVDSNLKRKWMKLLKDPTYGSIFIENTNAFILLQEAGPDFDWRRDMPYYIETTKAIRELTGVNTPCSLCGGYWGRRYDDLLQMGSAPLDNLLLNIDPYRDRSGKPGGGEEALNQIDDMRALNYTPFIGELGYKGVTTGDTLGDVDRRMGIAQKNGLAYFMWEMHKWTDLQDLFTKYNTR